MSEKNTRAGAKAPETGRRAPRSGFVVLAVIGLMLSLMYFNRSGFAVKELSEADFRALVESGGLDSVRRVRERDAGLLYLEGREKDAETPPGMPADAPTFRVSLVPGENDKLNEWMLSQGINCRTVEKASAFGPVARELMVVGILIAATWFIFFRGVRGGNGPFSVGKSRANVLSPERKKTTFADVAGVDEAKEEVEEIIEFLRAPERFRRLGGKIPKGVLLMGPPGTGKTLLARAIAGEAGVPFFSISGSDFEEMFVGVGASRVRDMFEQGKKNAPCIIFIDEIDAVGHKRSESAATGAHTYNEQTLNAMLVEMDGFDANDGVIIIAATNRPEVLDPALLRPGRFDRRIVIDLPTLKGREEILAIHAKRVKFAPDADLSRIARGTPGFSGADLASLINEAALLAARKSLDGVDQATLEESRDKVLWGRERRSAGYSRKERETTAWHEAGHALMQLLLEHTDPLHKVTVIPRGRALGATMSLPDHDILNRTRAQFTDTLAVMAGGRIAESFLTGDISTGAAQDIDQASRLARDMVCRYGMSERFGFQSFREAAFPFAGQGFGASISQKTAEAIDEEVRRLLDEAYARAERLLRENRSKLELLATTLVDEETMDGRDVAKLVGIDRPEAQLEDASGEERSLPNKDSSAS